MLSVERSISACTARTAVDAATERLAGTVTGTPRLDAEVLMSFVLGWSRARLFAHWDEGLTEEQAARYGALVERRAAGEPVAYIRNLKEFLGLDFYVDRRVLIPRPETELLVARALALAPGVVVDVGTGSGAVAVGIARGCPGAKVIATDISADALEVARLNAERHGAAVEFRQGSLLEPVAEHVDLVVANLPYLSQEEYRGLLHTSIAYEPPSALTDGADGLRLFDALLAQVPARLAPGGAVLLEIGSGQAAAVQRLARRRLPDFEPAVFADYAGLPRVLHLIPSPTAVGEG
jgi:release factor glutamine methyltransferase